MPYGLGFSHQEISLKCEVVAGGERAARHVPAPGLGRGWGRLAAWVATLRAEEGGSKGHQQLSSAIRGGEVAAEITLDRHEI